MLSIKKQLLYTSTLLLLHFVTLSYGKPPVPKDKLWSDYINTELPDSTRINALLSLSNQYLNFAPDSALLLAEQSRQRAEVSHFHRGEIIALTQMARANWSLGHYEQALNQAKKAISIAHQTESQSYLAPAYGIMGVVHEMWAQYDSALHYAQIAQTVARKYAPSTEGKYLMNIALVYELTGDYQKAFETYELSLEKFRSVRDSLGIGKVYNNLGVMYDLQGNYSKALTYYNKALKMRESKRHPALIATSLNNLGAIYLYQNDYKKALHYLKKALELRIEVNDRSNIASSYNNLGEVYLIQGELGKSKDSYQQAIDINKEIGHKRVEISSLGGMAKVYTQQKDLSQAMAYAQQALSLSKKLGIFKDICQNQLLVGELLYRQNRFQEAQIAARELVSLSSEKGMLEELKEAYHLLQICYSKTQQADSAFHYLKTYYAIKDSL